MRHGTGRVWASAGLAAVAVFCLGACTKGTSKTGSSSTSRQTSAASARSAGGKQNYHFVVVAQGPLTNPQWADYNAGIQAASKSLGVTTRYTGTTGTGVDAKELLQLISAGKASKPDGMLVTDNLSQSENPAIKDITSSGIPVVLFAAGSGQQEATGAISFVGKDYVDAAERAGEQFKALGCKSVLNVQLIKGASAQADQTTQGLQNTFKGRIVPTDIPAASNTDTSATSAIINSTLIKNPSIDCVFSGGGNFNAAVTAGEANLGGRTKQLQAHTGTDLAQAADFPKIQQGVMAFGINGQPYMIGYMALVQLYASIAWGATPTYEMSIGNQVITTANAANAIELSTKNGFY